MPRILFLLSLLLIVAAILVRSWHGKRIIAGYGGRRIRVNAAGWQNLFGEEVKAPATESSAAECGRALREAALVQWERDNSAASRGREAARRFGLGVPPFTLVVVIFAWAVAKLPFFTGIAVVFAATALAVMFGLASIGTELRAVAAATKLARARHIFPRQEDEEAAIACARAEVWMHTLPPILRWFS
ncbi:hypothetical protein KBB96_02185 [Luteolibacter ambystomatis]|uniref:Uncharacterized protein n=1 Tax=Luteolibacter ambystomatis TaxID=2824561 RepID=A0A975J0D6_9BACT|nr:hypothetical protein [Luteolibacter ambystomatis]QUE51709.1 hypothetical protein KBB96_02185 [Luteolibacter ambystomatis]